MTTEQDVERVRVAILTAMGINPVTHSYKYVAEAALSAMQNNLMGRQLDKSGESACGYQGHTEDHRLPALSMPNKHDDPSVVVAQEVRGGTPSVGIQMPSGGSIPSGHHHKHEKAYPPAECSNKGMVNFMPANDGTIHRIAADKDAVVIQVFNELRDDDGKLKTVTHIECKNQELKSELLVLAGEIIRRNKHEKAVKVFREALGIAEARIQLLNAKLPSYEHPESWHFISKALATVDEMMGE